MADASTDLRLLRPRLDGDPWAPLRGRFHSHLTVRATDVDLPALAEVCRAHHAKTTVVDLEDFAARTQRDVMATRYHQDDAPGAVGRVADDLLALCADLAAAGLPAVRAKVEHESESSLPAYGEHGYST